MLDSRETGKLRAGTQAYKYEMNVIKRVIRKHGELSVKKFDKIFGDTRMKRMPNGDDVIVNRWGRKLRFCGFTEESFILGSLRQGGDWAKWLNLTQIMAAMGDLKTKGKRENIRYVLAH